MALVSRFSRLASRISRWACAVIFGFVVLLVPSLSFALAPALLVSQPQAHVFKTDKHANLDAQAAQRNADLYLAG